MKLTLTNPLFKRTYNDLENKTGVVDWLCYQLPINTDIDELKAKLKPIELDLDKKKRSIQANAYCWTIIHKIAGVMKTTDEEIYHKMLIDYGTKEYVSTVPIIAKELEKSFKIVIQKKECVINDSKGFVYALIRGSSTYTVKEMQRFIDGIVFEAKKLNIETMTPEELKRLMKDYEVQNERA